MQKEIWVGIAELSSSPEDASTARHKGKGTFTWWACWVSDADSFKARVTDACGQYGLFITRFENVMAYKEAVQAGRVGDDLEALVERVSQDDEFCIFETLQGYTGGN